MVSKYYLVMKQQTDEQHLVHKEDCPFLPEISKRIYLGRFSSAKDALAHGQRYFIRVSCCRFCLKEYYSDSSQKEDCLVGNNCNFPSERQISLTSQGNLFYFLN